MTNKERDELLLQIVKNMGNVQESINSLSSKLDKTSIELNKKIDDTREELTQKIENVRKELTQKIEDVREELTQKIEDVREELTQKIEDTEERLNNKMDVNIKAAAQMFRDTWRDEHIRKEEIDSKIIDINKRLNM